MSTAPHQREPESLSKEIWFYSLERRAQSTALRRVSIALTIVAVLLVLVAIAVLPAAAGVVGAAAGVAATEGAGYVRSQQQRKSVLAQLTAGANPQLVDAVGTSLPNRTVILSALAVAVAVTLVALVVIGQLA